MNYLLLPQALVAGVVLLVALRLLQTAPPSPDAVVETSEDTGRSWSIRPGRGLAIVALLGIASYTAFTALMNAAIPERSVASDQVSFLPYPPPVHLPERKQLTRLGDDIEFLGYHTRLEESSALHVTLYWHALAPPQTSYKVFVHLLGAQEQIVSQKDSFSLDGQYPTTRWQSDEVIVDRYALPLGGEVRPGEYRVAIGLYDEITLQRLPVFDTNGGRVPGDRILLDTIVLIGME